MNRRGDHGVSDHGFRKPRNNMSNCFKDKEEELSFFRDLHKHEKDDFSSLLPSVSEEFGANGNYGLYRMESGGRKGRGVEFLAETGKNDYNWLKTPPATPLFPSLEMEANPQEQVIHRELPIFQPPSRFAGNPESNNISTAPNTKPKFPQRHKTQTGRSSISSNKKNKTVPVVNPKMNQTTSPPDKTKQAFTPIIIKSNILQKESHPNFLSSNLSKNIGTVSDSNQRPKSRGISPFLRPNSEFSDETPSNLRTINRPTSTTRGRPTINLNQKQDLTAIKTRRHSCSPSVTRGQKVDSNGNAATQTSTPKVQQAGNLTQVLGSRMVEKFMNARNFIAEEKQAKIKLNKSVNENSKNYGSNERQGKVKLNGSVNESSGFGRLMSKNSLDMALKHMEFQREQSNTRKHGMLGGRKY